MRTIITRINFAFQFIYLFFFSLNSSSFQKLVSKTHFLLLLLFFGAFPLMSQEVDTTLKVVSKLHSQEITEKFVLLYESIEIFKDEKGDATFEEVAANATLLQENKTKEGYETDNVYWVKLNLKAGKDYQDTCYFYVEELNGFRSWEKITAFMKHEDGRVEKQQTGYGFLVKEKSVSSLNHAVCFALDSAENAQLFFRLEGVRKDRICEKISIWARRIRNAGSITYLNHHLPYQFDGKFGKDRAESPFRRKKIRNIQALEAPDSLTTFEDLLLHKDNWRWEDDPFNVIMQKDKTYWIKTRLIGTNSFSGEQILHASSDGDEYVMADYVDVYISKNGSDFTHQRTGNLVPLKERPYNFWATFIKVKLAPKDTLDLFIRLKPGANKSSVLFVLPRLCHIDSSSIFPRQVEEAQKTWFFIGILFIQFLFFLSLFFIEKESIHAYFAVFILGIFLLLAFNVNFTYPSFVPFPEWYPYFAHLFNSGVIAVIIGFLKFTETYFKYPKSSIYTKKIIPIIIVFHIIVYFYYIVLNEFDLPQSLPNVGLLFVGLHVLSILFSFLLAIRAKQQVRLLKLIWFVAMTPVVLILLGYALLVLSDIFHMNMNEYYLIINVLKKYFLFSIIFMLTVFSLSIGYRKNLLKREKEKALQQNLKDQQTIIEKLEQTAKLEKMDEVKTRFFTNITHEFRTPLTVILGMKEQLESGSWTAKVSSKEQNRLANGLNLIERNGQKLLQLVNQLLDLSKIDSANLKANYQLKEVVSFVQYVGESFESLAAKKSIRLQIYNEMEDLTMAVDEIKLQKIIANLLSNAIKFTPNRGKVTLHLSQQDKVIQIKVKDTGEGISETALPYIFDRFYQVDNTASRKGEGTGIGLALVKELVKLMEGTIQVKSQLGKGAEFVILLPIHTTITESLAQEKASEETAEQANFLPTDQAVLTEEHPPTKKEIITPLNDNPKPHLLIAEDNPDVVFYIQSILDPYYQITTAVNGAEGIETALEAIPDLIISDVMMPVKDGFELVETLKKDERTSHIPMILLTAKATQQDKLAGLQYGADAYLTKPFNKEELLVRLNKLLELRQKLQAKYQGLEPSVAADSSPSPEDEFLQKLRDVVEDRLDDADLAIVHLCRAVGLSHTQVYRKLKALTNKTPGQFIRTIRLQKAMELLKTTEMNVSEVAYEVGFNDPNYFSKVFQQMYGKIPSGVRR